MLQRAVGICIALMLLGLGGCAAISTAGDPAARMDPGELKARLGEPGLQILDVRSPADWEGSDRKIVGAVREDPNTVSEWAGKYAKGDTLVLYCA